MNTDELFEQMERDELEDRLQLVENPKMTPIDYARMRGIRPQKVYAALRNGKLTWDRCDCGRRVVVVSEADEVFNIGTHSRTNQALQAAEEVSGSGLES